MRKMASRKKQNNQETWNHLFAICTNTIATAPKQTGETCLGTWVIQLGSLSIHYLYQRKQVIEPHFHSEINILKNTNASDVSERSLSHASRK